MARYLSREWLDEFKTLAQDQPGRPGATFTAQFNVEDGPDGDIEYYWVMEDGKLTEAAMGPISDPDICLSTTYGDSVKVQRGEIAAAAAFMQGKLKATGDVKMLMKFMPVATSPEWRELDEKVRAISEF